MGSIKPNDFLGKIFKVKGRIAVITGGNSQLGTEYCFTLARAGAKVAVFDIAEKFNPKLARLSKQYPVKLFKVNITERKQLQKGLRAVEKLWNTPSILINNAALDSPPGARAEENKSFENYSKESWQRVLDVNLTGTFLSCQVIGGLMAKRGGGSIINIASTYGLVSPNQNIYAYRKKMGKPFVKPVSYSAAKSAILNFTRYLAVYWAKKQVRVNTLTPGGVFNNQDKEFLKNYASLVPMGRMAKEDELNGAILFLASDASSYMTGANLVIDGGWTAW